MKPEFDFFFFTVSVKSIKCLCRSKVHVNLLSAIRACQARRPVLSLKCDTAVVGRRCSGGRSPFSGNREVSSPMHSHSSLRVKATFNSHLCEQIQERCFAVFLWLTHRPHSEPWHYLPQKRESQQSPSRAPSPHYLKKKQKTVRQCC